MRCKVSGVHELIKAKVKSVPDVPIRASTHIECEKVIDASSGECQQLLKKLFNLYDTDHSGFLELPEFVSICRVHDPEMAPELAYRAYAAVAQPAVSI